MAAGRGAGAVRPQRDFGLHPELLPSLHVGADTVTRGFAALTDRRLGLVAVVDRADWVERVLASAVCTGHLRIKEGAREHLSREVLRSAGLRVGLSTHSDWEECRAHAWAPSCIACGPIHIGEVAVAGSVKTDCRGRPHEAKHEHHVRAEEKTVSVHRINAHAGARSTPECNRLVGRAATGATVNQPRSPGDAVGSLGALRQHR